MAAKSPKSLKSRIEKLINSLGETPVPSLAKIRGELVTFASLAEALEDGNAVRKAEAKIKVLETALGKSNTENSNLKGELDAAKAAIKMFRDEQKEREKKEAEPNDIQLRILIALPSESEGGVTVRDISKRLSMDIGDMDFHLAWMRQHQYAICWRDVTETWHWNRTIKGQGYIMAKRLAGEEGEEHQAQAETHPDLTKLEQIVLLIVAKGEGETVEEITKHLAVPTMGKPTATGPMVVLLLIKLREKGMATDGDESTYGTAPRWHILRAGMEYLAERGLL